MVVTHVFKEDDRVPGNTFKQRAELRQILRDHFDQEVGSPTHPFVHVFIHLQCPIRPPTHPLSMHTCMPIAYPHMQKSSFEKPKPTFTVWIPTGRGLQPGDDFIVSLQNGITCEVNALTTRINTHARARTHTHTDLIQVMIPHGKKEGDQLTITVVHVKVAVS